MKLNLDFDPEKVAFYYECARVYLRMRKHYKSSVITYKPSTGDKDLDEDIKRYLQRRPIGAHGHPLAQFAPFIWIVNP